MIRLIPHLIVLSIFAFAVSHAYVFRCLDDACLCDTDEELISCHNNSTRTEIPLPAKRLRGFRVIGISKNNIRSLPSEEKMKEKFPDLQGIDVIGNPDFDCDQIQEYKRIHILSSCGNETADATVEVYMPTEANTKKHAETAHAYMKELWESVLEKIEEIRQHEFVKEVETSVKGVANDVYDWFRHHTK